MLALLIGDGAVDLQVSCAGGVVILRPDAVFETEGCNIGSTDLLAREIKITLGQMRPTRDAARKVRLRPQRLGAPVCQ